MSCRDQAKKLMSFCRTHGRYNMTGCGSSVHEVITNNIHPYLFAAVLQYLLEHRQGVFGNKIIIGPANCRKNVLLVLLQTIFKTFSNPANNKNAWIRC